MKRQFDNYRRLAKGLFSCSSFWAGPDHFVFVRGTGVFLPFVEEYKRFRFEDVHAITMAPTRMYLWTTFLFGFGAALSAALVFLPDYEPDTRIVMFVLLTPVLVVSFACFLVTLARGPSCRCRIETSVGSVVIRPMSRRRSALRAVEEMSELVRSVQGSEFPEGGGVAGGSGEGEESAAEALAAKGPHAGDGPGRIERSAFLLPTFSLIAVLGVLWVTHAFVMHWWPLPVLGLLNLLVFLGLSVSLVQQMRGYTPGAILGVLWAGMAQQFVLMGAAFLVYIYWSVQTGIEGSSSGLVSLGNFYTEGRTAGVVYFFSVINGVAGMILGLAGVGLLWRHRDRMRQIGKPPSLPPAVAGGRREEGGG